MAQGTLKRAGMTALVAGLLMGLLVTPVSAQSPCDKILNQIASIEDRKSALAKEAGVPIFSRKHELLLGTLERRLREKLNETGCWRAENKERGDCVELYAELAQTKKSYKKLLKTLEAKNRALKKAMNGLKILTAAYEKQCGKLPAQTTAGTDDGKKAGTPGAGAPSTGVQSGAPSGGELPTAGGRATTTGAGRGPTAAQTGTHVRPQKEPPATPGTTSETRQPPHGTQVSSGAEHPAEPHPTFRDWDLSAFSD